LHRGQFRSRFPGVATPLPAVFRLVDGRPLVCVEAAALTACSGLPDLEALIRRNCADTQDPDGRPRNTGEGVG
jgi:hypothetical protein